MTAPAPTARELLERLAEADNNVAVVTGQLKAAKEAYERVADQLFALMDEQGTDRLSNVEIGLQVSISETDTDTIEDWDKFTRFVLRTKNLSLFQRRLSGPALREMREQLGEGHTVPGLGVFTRRKLHVTKYSK